MAKVSIIMGIYNVGNVLKESIDSILSQTFTDWELIMCDDGSEDNTYDVAKSYVDKYPNKMILLKNKKNKGLEYSLNKCLSQASGDYIARQDGDDRSLNDRLSTEVEFLDNHPEYSLVGTNMLFFDENGIWGNSNFGGEVTKEDFAFCSPFMHPTIVIRKSALTAVNGYKENTGLTRVEDYYLWLRLYMAGYKGFNLIDCLYEYRDDRNAFSKRTVKNRISLFKIMEYGVSSLGLPVKYKLAPFKQLALMLVPGRFYAALHKMKYRTD